MKLYRRDEIVNKHGKYIAYFSKSSGRTDLEKLKNSFIYNENMKEYIIKGKNEMLTCIVNSSHGMRVFNSLDELIEDVQDLQDGSKESVEQALFDLDLL